MLTVCQTCCERPLPVKAEVITYSTELNTFIAPVPAGGKSSHLVPSMLKWLIKWKIKTKGK